MNVTNFSINGKTFTISESYSGKVIINLEGKEILNFSVLSLKSEKAFFVDNKEYVVRRKYGFISDHVYHIIYHNDNEIFSTYKRYSDLVYSIITIIVIATIAYTNPSKETHLKAIYKEYSIIENFDDFISTSETFHLNLFLLSICAEKHKYFTVGVLGKVFVFKD